MANVYSSSITSKFSCPQTHVKSSNILLLYNESGTSNLIVGKVCRIDPVAHVVDGLSCILLALRSDSMLFESVMALSDSDN